MLVRTTSKRLLYSGMQYHFEAELNGKTWRLVRTWYKGTYSCLRTVDLGISHRSNSVETGGGGGSVLFPAPLLLVIAPTGVSISVIPWLE